MPALQSRLRFIFFSILVISLALAVACGGSDDGDDNGGNDNNGGSNPTATPRGSNNNSGNVDINATVASSLNPGTASVTIGDKTYDFEMTGFLGGQCVTLFGIVAGAGRATDGSDVTVSLSVPPPDYKDDPMYVDFDPPEITVDDDETEQKWEAGGENLLGDNGPRPGESQVDSWTSDGKSASGTATFIDTTALFRASAGLNDRPEPVKGTFEVNCG